MKIIARHCLIVLNYTELIEEYQSYSYRADESYSKQIKHKKRALYCAKISEFIEDNLLWCYPSNIDTC